MIHFIPESPATADVPAEPTPYAQAVARLASIQRALTCVSAMGGNPAAFRDSEARLALGYQGAPDATRRAFDQRSTRAAAGAASGLAAIAAQTAQGRVPNPAALAKLTAEIEADMTGLDRLFSL